MVRLKVGREKADLRQTGLSIKKSWQQFVADWVQPEWKVAKRLFDFEDSYSSLLGSENQPFSSTIDEITRFSDRLTFFEWPFDFDAAVSQPFPESISEQIQGRKRNFSSRIKEDSRNSVLPGQKHGPITNEVSRNYPALAEPAALSIIPPGIQEERESLQPIIQENKQNEIELPGARQKAEAGKPFADARLRETSHADTEWFEGKHFGSVAVKNFSIPDEGQTINKKEQWSILPREPMAGYPLELNDGNDKPNLSWNVPIPGNTDNPSTTNSHFLMPSETESPGLNAENPAFLPPVKNLQNLGLWLKENFPEEPLPREMGEKGTSTIHPVQINGFENDLSVSGLLDAESWENSPNEFFNHNNISPESSNRVKNPYLSFDSPPDFMGEQTSKPDPEVFLQELTEHLNREFKRFYGA